MAPPALLLAPALVVGLVAGSPSAPRADDGAALRRDAELAWHHRADGFLEHGRPDGAAVARAIASWSRALELETEDLPTRFALIQALYFDGHFVESDRDRARARFEQQLDLALETRELIARPLGGWQALDALEPDARAARLRGLPHAAEAELWSAVSWGLWGMSHSKLAAARRGVAERIREHAALLHAVDPGYADAAGDRLLGRLHTATPRVPLVTGWLDRQLGIERLRRANAVSSRDGRNPLFLAEALLRHRRREREEALALLREVACRRPAEKTLVEDSETIAAARRLLREEGDEGGVADLACRDAGGPAHATAEAHR